MTLTAHSYDPLPRVYFLFFAVVEPFLTYLGAIYAVVTPSEYFISLFPSSLVPAPLPHLVHPASVMATRQLGSCFFLFALFGSILLPRVKHVLMTQNDDGQGGGGGGGERFEKFVEAYLACLALADLTHIGFTLFDLGLTGATRPFVHWNQLVVGNVVITVGLFAVRIMWFSQIGRESYRTGRAEIEKVKSK